jgi:hypothetical protein
MCSYNEKETLSTLQFGQRAKCIKNTVTANIERSAKELERLLEIAELKIKEYENVIKKLSSGEKVLIPMMPLEPIPPKMEPEIKELLNEVKEVSESSNSPNNSSKPLPKPKKKIVYTIGTQTDPLPEPEVKPKKPKTKVDHEEIDMLEDMNSEEEMAYLQKMEEEAIKKLEEEEVRIKEMKEKEKAAKQKGNLIIEELDPSYEDSPNPKPGTIKHFISKTGSDKLIPVSAEESKDVNENETKTEPENTKGPSEAAYIAQTLQLIDKNLEVKKIKEEKDHLEEELRIKKEDIEDLREKFYESQEVQKTFQLACKAFVEKMKQRVERALLQSQEKAGMVLKLARDLDQLNLKLIFISNDSDLKHVMSKSGLEPASTDAVAELSRLSSPSRLHP